MDLNQMTDEQLKKEFESLYDMIYRIGCYSISDLKLYHQIGIELESRGYKLEEYNKFEWKKSK